MSGKSKSILKWVLGIFVVLAAYAWWSDSYNSDVGQAPTRGILHLLAPAKRYDTRANYVTAWSRGSMVRPTFIPASDVDADLECDVQERSAAAEEPWRRAGILNGESPPAASSTLYVRIKQRKMGRSTYSIAADPDFKGQALPVGGVGLDIDSGTERNMCLSHASAGRPNSEGALPLWYCALSYSPETQLLSFVGIPAEADATGNVAKVRHISGICRSRSHLVASPSSMPAPRPEPSVSTPQPQSTDDGVLPDEPATPAVQQQPLPETVGDSICSTSVDGRYVTCGSRASICSNSLDGNDVDCGGLSSICSTSLKGNDVACGGRSSICSTSLIGARVSCGGRASICSTSLNGADVSCGGDATICSTSLDGRDVACGGRATICSTSLDGGDVACGGDATICSTSLDGRDVACGGSAQGCSTSLDGRRRACAGDRYSRD